ncbi:DUF389 domain-containing protein [Gordonia sp. NPDC003429]
MVSAAIRSALIPDSQRRTLVELEERLDFAVGDRSAKRSAFWIMLTLSGIIAIAGIIGDSTATVIGAMIVAPLSTPILGIGHGIVTGRRHLIVSSVGYVVAGAAVVTLMGVLLAQVIPNPVTVLSNAQVLGRTSPTIDDLLAALATGLVGAIAITRRDVGDVLPGVAIAISLVPPLGVVGVCLGSGAPALALGAFILFASNVVAMVITSIVVLTMAGYAYAAAVAYEGPVTRRRNAYIAVAVALVIVLVPMVGYSLSSLWVSQITGATKVWLSDGGVRDTEVSGVSISGESVTVNVLGPHDLPPVSSLRHTVDRLLPWNPEVTVIHTVGRRQTG